MKRYLSLYRRRGIGTGNTLTQLRSHGFNTCFDLFCSAFEISWARLDDDILDAEGGR